MKIPRSLAALGEVLDLRVERDGRRSTLRWNSAHWLCGEASAKRLWIVPASREEPAPLEDFEEDLRDAIKLYRRWHDLTPIGATAIEVKVSDPPVFRGFVNVIGYRSDKWSGDFDNYDHVFTSPPQIEKFGEVYRISGGALRVTAGGITG